MIGEAGVLPYANSFISLIKVDGVPIPIPPSILPEDRKNIEEWRKQAIAIEEKLLQRRQHLNSSGIQKIRPQGNKIGAIPARSANFEERPQSRSISGEQVLVRRALTSAAYNDEKTQLLAGMLQKVALEDPVKDSDAASQKSLDENGHVQQVSSSVTSGPPIPSASSTDLEPYLSQSSTSTEGSGETVRPETNSAENFDGQQLEQQQPNASVARGSYTIETPSSALLQYKQKRLSPTKDVSGDGKPQFGHLGSMVARYLTEQQRAKHLSEFAKLQSILQENAPTSSEPIPPNSDSTHSADNTPSKRLPGQSETSPSIGVGVKRRIGGETTHTRKSATEFLVAAVRGYLVRRVMQTAKVQHWIQTISDCRKLLTPEPSPGLDWRSLTDSRFREQLGSQLLAALQEFHTIMFDWPLGDRLALIAKDNMPRGATPRSASSRGGGGIKPRVSPGAATAASRGRSLSASSAQHQQQGPQKHQASVIASLRTGSNAVDVTKRRRIGAVTPPRTTPTNPPAPQPPVRRPLPPGRPNTAAGTTGTRSPGVVSRTNSHGGISPRVQNPPHVNGRPSTAAPSALDSRNTSSRRNVADATITIAHATSNSNFAPAAISSSSRRSTLSGPPSNISRR